MVKSGLSLSQLQRPCKFKTLSLLLLLMASLLTTSCGDSRNIDENDRWRRLGGTDCCGGGGNGGGDGPLGPTPDHPTAPYISSAYFGQLIVANSVIQLPISMQVGLGDGTGFEPPGVNLYINTETDTVSIFDEDNSFKEISKISCVNTTNNRCTEFNVSLKLGDFLPKKTRDDAKGISFEFAYKVAIQNLELVDVTSTLEKRISKVYGAEIRIKSVKESVPVYNLYTDTLLSGLARYYLYYEVSQQEIYDMFVPVEPPSQNFILHSCTQHQKDDILTYQCDFLNPVDNTIVTTKKVLRHAQTN